MSRCGSCKLYDNGCEGNMCIEACVYTLQDYICDIMARAEAAEARAEKAEKEIERLKSIMRNEGIMMIPSKYPECKSEWNLKRRGR